MTEAMEGAERECLPLDPSKRHVIATGCGKNAGKGKTVFCDLFRNEATPPDQLDELCFSNLSKKTMAIEEGVAPDGSGGSVAEVSCASSTCTVGGNGNLAVGGSTHGIKGTAALLGGKRGISEQINARLLQRTTSRHGRSSQRWASDPLSHSAIRLTTGCVPIVKGRKVLFVSASSKPSWIFPKGGWEMDEDIEESALREAYEEAGVIGILGPKLSDVQYETRKARKRRLETEEILKLKRERPEDPGKAPENSDRREEKSYAGVGSQSLSLGYTDAAGEDKPNITTLNPAPISDEAIARMRGDVVRSSKQRTDDTSSAPSDNSSYSLVRMSLFPLYVTTIKKEWPESGRLRRAVPIEEAIKILEGRPELQAALVEVKKRGLQIPPDDL